MKFKKRLTFIASKALVFSLLFGTSVAFANTGTINSSDVNIRDGASTNCDVLKKLSEGDKVEVINTSDQWAKVTSGKTTGWIYKTYINLPKSNNAGYAALINADDVNVRQGPGKSYEAIVAIGDGAKVNVLDSNASWTKIRTASGYVGWVLSTFVTTQKKAISRSYSEPEQQKENSISSGDTASEVVSYGKNLLGVRYVWGGTSLSGFDCSGFTSYVFAKFGIKLDRVAADQARNGRWVSRDQLKPGDLVLFDTNGGHNDINHVGIYIGDNQFMHASSGRSAHRVVISGLNEDFYSNSYMTGRRITE